MPHVGDAELTALQARLTEVEAELAGARRLLDLSSEVHVRHSPDETTSFWSDGLQHLLGIDPATATPGNVRERVHPDDRPGRLAARLYADAGVTSTSVVRMLHTDGTWRTVEVTVAPVLGLDGSLMEVNAVLRDVTPLSAARRARAELEAALDALPRSVTLLTVAQREDGSSELRVHYANHFVRKALGRTEDELVGRPCAEVFLPTRLPSTSRAT